MGLFQKNKRQDDDLAKMRACASQTDWAWVETWHTLPSWYRGEKNIPADILARVEELRPIAEAEALERKVRDRRDQLAEIEMDKKIQREKREREERSLTEASSKIAKAQSDLAELEAAIRQAKQGE